MKIIATIDGHNVYSDKSVHSIINSRVNFTDGSWCDVTTGQTFNNGTGYLTIDSPATSSTSSTLITKGPTVYRAQPLTINNVASDVHVRVGSDASKMEVAIIGTERALKSIRIAEEGGRLVIEGEGQSDESARFIQTKGGSVMYGNNSSDNIIITGQVGSVSGMIRDGHAESDTKVLVIVPVRTAVSVSGVVGKTMIGDTDGPLSATAMSGDLNAGRIRDANLSVQGSYKIQVREVNGTLSAVVQGSGGIEVSGGMVSSLIASVQGSGDIKCEARAQNASLTVHGSGDIHINHVVNRPLKKVMGSGDISIGNW